MRAATLAPIATAPAVPPRIAEAADLFIISEKVGACFLLELVSDMVGLLDGFVLDGLVDGWMVWWMDGIGTVFESHKRRRRSTVYRIIVVLEFLFFFSFLWMTAPVTDARIHNTIVSILILEPKGFCTHCYT